MSNKVYYITESQFKALMEKKKAEKLVLKEMLEEIKQKKLSLRESAELINEGIIDTLKNYVRKGLMTTAVIASLLASNQVNAQQLQAAGVPQSQIELAQGGSGDQSAGSETGSQIPLNKIEDRLLRAMKRAGLKGSLEKYNKLTPQQKQKILTGIQGKIKSLDDVDKYNSVSIGGWTQNQQSGDGVIQFDQQNQVKIAVDTSDVMVSVPLKGLFNSNSSELTNPEEARQFLIEQFGNFVVVDSIVIDASSSTLRNTGAAEGKTWMELSQERANSIVQVINGVSFDLGNQGVNNPQQITTNMININVKGDNGDGTSGPKSPFEVNPQVVAAYQARGIDPKFWQSAAKENPLADKSQYENFQKVDIVIYGRIVTTNTEDVPSYRYIVLQTRQEGGHVKVKGNNKKADVSKCPVKFKTPKVKVPKGSVLQGMR